MPSTKTKPITGKAGNTARTPATKKPKHAGLMTDNMSDAEEEAFFQGIADDMTEAAQAAIAENDRLGIPSVGTRHGKRVVRQPPKKAPTP
jgi:hypothetical protein